MIDRKQFRNANGLTDWAAYRRACIMQGQNCQECEEYITAPTGRPSLCVRCAERDRQQDGLMSDTLVRCPHCGNRADGNQLFAAEPYCYGRHVVNCLQCHREFDVYVHNKLFFKSPAVQCTDIPNFAPQAKR